MAGGYHERFKNLIEEISPRIETISTQQLFHEIKNEEDTVIIDVRERDEWIMSHIPEALCIPKSIIERDIEYHVPYVKQKIVLYSRGGYLSLIAADNLQKMGYENAFSLKGGYHAWTIGGNPLHEDGEIIYPGEEYIQQLLKDNPASPKK